MAKGSTARAREEIASKKAAEDRARRAQAAMALFERATALHSRGQTDEAIAANNRLVARFGSTNELGLLVLTAHAQFNNGFILQSTEPSAAIKTWDTLLARFGAATEPPLMEAVAKTLQSKGFLLHTLRRVAEAIKVYDELEDRFGSTTEPVLEGIVLANRFNKKIALYDEIVEQFDKISNPTLDERVTAATAIVDKAIAFSGTTAGKETAIENYDEVVKRFGNADELRLRERVVRALFNKGVVQLDLDRGEKAIASFDELEARFGKSDEPVLQERLIRALTIKGNYLENAKRYDEAFGVFDEALVRLCRVSQPSLVDRRSHAYALRHKAQILGLVGRRDEEIAAYDELVARFGTDTDPALRGEAAVAFKIKGLRFEEDDQFEEAIAAYQKALSLRPDDDAATRFLEQARARFDGVQAEQSVTQQASRERENSQLVSERTGYTVETPSSEAAPSRVSRRTASARWVC